MKYLFYFFITVSCTITACLPPPIDVDVEPAPPRLCIASQVFGNSGIVVGLTRSYSPLEGSVNDDSTGQDLLERLLVENAVVTIDYSGGTDTLYQIAPGIYTSIVTTLNAGETYTIRAYDPAYNLNVWAATTMQSQMEFDTLYPVITRTAQDTSVSFKFKLIDNVNSNNYYVVNFVKKVQGDSTFDINNIFAAGSNEVLTEFELYDDRSFENGVLNKEIRVFSAHHTDTVAVVVSEITQGYYEFLTAFKRSSSVFNQLTGEPINYPTNVNGGHGYFTMHRMNATVFDLNQY